MNSIGLASHGVYGGVDGRSTELTALPRAMATCACLTAAPTGCLERRRPSMLTDRALKAPIHAVILAVTKRRQEGM
jgi:hypothetical protein